VYPVLNSDYPDRRAGRDDGRATWRLRRREEVFGCREFGELGLLGDGVESGTRSGDIVLFKRQKVYGAQDYDWKSISEVIGVIEDRYKARRDEVAAVGVEVGR